MKKSIVYLICLAFLQTVTLFGMQQHTSTLMQAIKNGDKEAFNKLINNKVDVNEKDAKGATALHYAAYHLNKDMIIALIDAGAKINTQDNEGKTPLHYATSSGYGASLEFETGLKPILDLLILHGADISLRDKNNKTPVFGSVARPAVQAYLRNKRIPPTAHDLALFEAINKNNMQEAEQLIKIQKANPNAWRKYGPVGTLSPLRAAIQIKNLALVEMLLAAGADIHERDQNDNTPLYHAIESDSPAIVAALIEAGADVNAYSGDQDFEEMDLSPLEAAKKTNNKEIINLIKDASRNLTKQKHPEPPQNSNRLVVELHNLEQTLKQLTSVL